MLELMKREPFKMPLSTHAADQGNAFTGLGIPEGTKLWSKAGHTSRTRHDAALIELANGARFVLVTFTEGHSRERGIIAEVTREVVEGLMTGGSGR
jgi:hypothetical protein